MNRKLANIAKSLAQTAVNAYNNNSTFLYAYSNSEQIIQKVYNELLLGIKTRSSPLFIGKNVARVALLAYWNVSCTYFGPVIRLDEKSAPFTRATVATTSMLNKVIRETKFEKTKN